MKVEKCYILMSSAYQTYEVPILDKSPQIDDILSHHKKQ